MSATKAEWDWPQVYYKAVSESPRSRPNAGAYREAAKTGDTIRHPDPDLSPGANPRRFISVADLETVADCHEPWPLALFRVKNVGPTAKLWHLIRSGTNDPYTFLADKDTAPIGYPHCAFLAAFAHGCGLAARDLISDEDWQQLRRPWTEQFGASVDDLNPGGSW